MRTVYMSIIAIMALVAAALLAAGVVKGRAQGNGVGVQVCETIDQWKKATEESEHSIELRGAKAEKLYAKLAAAVGGEENILPEYRNPDGILLRVVDLLPGLTFIDMDFDIKGCVVHAAMLSERDFFALAGPDFP